MMKRDVTRFLLLPIICESGVQRTERNLLEYWKAPPLMYEESESQGAPLIVLGLPS